MAIFTTLILLIQEHGISFHSLSHLQFSLSMFYSSQQLSFSLLWLGLFIGFFNAILDRIVLFSLSDISFLV